MKILMAADFYPPFIGGAERQTQLLAKQLTERGHDISVATVWHAGSPARRDDDGVTVFALQGFVTRVPWFSSDTKRRFHPPFPDPCIVWHLRRLIRRLRPDIVHSTGWITYSCAAALLGMKVPLVISVRDYGFTCAKRTMLHNGTTCTGPAPMKCLQCASQTYGVPKATVAVAAVFGYKPLLKLKTRAIHSISSYVHTTIQRDMSSKRLKIDNHTISVIISDPGPTPRNKETISVIIPGLLDQDDYPSSEHGHIRRFPSEPYILFVGALQSHKGVPVLLEAYEQLSMPPPLVLIGSVWPDSPTSFPPGVTVIQNVPHQVVMEAWQGCLFGVAPSVWPEPLGGVVREAMSAGKAVIGTATGGIPDLIDHGRNGLLIPPEDVPALAAAMQRLIADASLRERLGAAASIAAAEYSPEKLVPRFEALYRDVATSPLGR